MRKRTEATVPFQTQDSDSGTACAMFLFFNPYIPLTNTYERQICSLRHTLILYSIQFFLDCMEFFLAQRELGG